MNLFNQNILNKMSWYSGFPLTPPEKITFLMTHKCPLNCLMCWTKEADQKSEPDIKWLYKAIRDASLWKGVKEIMFSGGEPLLRYKEVIELVTYANSLGLYTSVISSGWNINYKILKQLHGAGLNCFLVSLDGANAETHDKIRGKKGSFDKLIQLATDIDNLKKIPRPYIPYSPLKDQFYFSIMSVILKQNHNQLTDIYNLIMKMKADSINFQAVTTDAKEKGLWIEKHELPELEKQINNLIKLKKDDGRISNRAGFLKTVPLYFSDNTIPKKVKCYAGYGDLIIKANKSASTCFGDAFPDNSISDPTIQDLWKSKQFYKDRKKMKYCNKKCLLTCWDYTS